MRYSPERHHRRSIRLRGYDYTQAGAYFITIVAHERALLFGEIVNGTMRLNEYGQIVRDEWFRTAVVRPYVMLYPDEFVVMPNHIHGIIWIVGATRRVAPTYGIAPTDGGVAPTTHPSGRPTLKPHSIGSILAQFKSLTTKRINALRGTPGAAIWQRNYYEHIIRDERSLQQIRHYILENPQRWEQDSENPYRAVRL
jgi:putative transposase